MFPLLCRLLFAGCLFVMTIWVPTVDAHQHNIGPQIIVLSPVDGDVVTAPFEVDVRFVTAPDTQIDTETLKVEVQKLMWGVDVTEEIRQFATAAGIHIAHADFPKGHHTVTLHIADAQGRKSSKTVTMDVH